MPLPFPANNTRLTGPLNETMVSTVKSSLQAIIPDATTIGTIVIRDAAAISGESTPVSSSAINLTQQGKQFGPNGVMCLNGISIVLSAADTVTVVWAPV